VKNIHTIHIPEDEGRFFQRIQYPAGEHQIRLTRAQADLVDKADEVRVVSRTSLMPTALLIDAIKYVINGRRPPYLTLVLPYLPYARADRRFTDADCFGIGVYGEHIDMMACDKVLTFDVHSSVAKRHIANLVSIKVDELITSIVNTFPSKKDLTILLPDEGSLHRYALPKDVKTDNCKKKRNPATGVLGGFEVPKITTRQVLIVDDICDGGGTFVGIAQEIKKQTEAPVDLFLYVTHGIFSRGLDPLSIFRAVYCTDSFLSPDVTRHRNSTTSLLVVNSIDKLLEEYHST